MKKMLVAGLCLLSSYVQGYETLPKELPKIPANCITRSRNYCVYAGTISTTKGKVVRVSLYARVYDYESIDEIKNIYMDYAKWGEYAKKSKMDSVFFNKSIALAPKTVTENGVEKTVYPHYADYVVDGPLGIDFDNRELAHNWVAETAPGADLTLMFSLAPTPYSIPGVDVKGPYGLVYKSGVLHIRYDKDEDAYYLYSITDVKPDVNEHLFGLADGPIARGIESIFKGMFFSN
jgi:hypothetical protein